MGNQISSTPYGTQSNLVNVPLTCNYLLGSTDIFNATVSFTSPLVGKDVYFSNVEASLGVPEAFSFYGENNPGPVVATINITLNLESSAPPSTLLRQTVTQDAADKTFRWSFDRQGPFALTVDQQSRSLLGKVEMKFEYANLTVYGACGETRAVISSVTGRDEVNTIPDTAAVEYPPTKPGEKAVVVNAPTTCRDTSGESRAFNITVRGVIPVNPSGSFNITNVNTFVTIPGDLVEQWSNANRSLQLFAYGKLPNGADQSFPGLQMVTTQSPRSKDWSREWTSTVGDTTKPMFSYRLLDGVYSEDLVIALPAAGSLTIGEYAAENGRFSLWLIGFDGFAGGYDTNGEIKEVGSVHFRCENNRGEIFSVYSA